MVCIEHSPSFMEPEVLLPSLEESEPEESNPSYSTVLP